MHRRVPILASVMDGVCWSPRSYIVGVQTQHNLVTTVATTDRPSWQATMHAFQIIITAAGSAATQALAHNSCVYGFL